MKCDNIHISFAKDEIILSGNSGIVQAVQVLPFFEYLTFRRIKIFRLCITHHSSAETYYLIVDILYREHNTIDELVRHPFAFIENTQSGFSDKLIIISLVFKISDKIITVLKRIAQSEMLHRFLCERSVGQIFFPQFSVFGTKLMIKILLRFIYDLHQTFALIGFPSHLFRILDLGELYICTLCKHLNSFGKSIILILHHE
ncbi:MAG: hypothetical protein BWY61_01873 [Firmicutes bacterium ADurb.Bin354]|nr:MAG: hypothetical protein BWY61_01873 [Firmicutes bacterium ADurb.Bin354]